MPAGNIASTRWIVWITKDSEHFFRIESDYE